MNGFTIVSNDVFEVDDAQLAELAAADTLCKAFSQIRPYLIVVAGIPFLPSGLRRVLKQFIAVGTKLCD